MADIIVILALAAMGGIYFLPSIVARGRANAGSIFFLNLILGWTVVVWIVCFIWASVAKRPPRKRDEFLRNLGRSDG